jgi:hypothetical protein
MSHALGSQESLRTFVTEARVEPRITNLPEIVDRRLYQEAVDLYLQDSADYLEALYGFGNQRYPGLSDLDLLVVPRNGYFAPLRLHILGRLPQRFNCILEHEVFVVPESFTVVCSYTHASNLRLLHGRDVLAGTGNEIPPAARVCHELERLYNAQIYAKRLRHEQVIDARSSMRVFNSFRFSLKRLEELRFAEEGGYGAEIDRLRSRYMEDRAESWVAQMYRLFDDAVRYAVRSVSESIDVDVTSTSDIKALSYGERSLPLNGFEPEDARKRARVARAYRQDLDRRHFWYGTLFLNAFFPPHAKQSLLFRTFMKGARIARRLSQKSVRPA